MKCDPKVPCKSCVFRRDSKPGHEDLANLGGSEAKVYIGQSFGPFAIPCHTFYDLDDPTIIDRCGPGETPQCAGVAIFRANAKLNDYLPKQLPRLPEDHETVFSNAEQFIAHHLNLTLETAYSLLRTPGFRIQDLVKQEMSKAVRVIQ